MSITSSVVNSTSIFVSWQPPPVQYHNGIIRMYTIRITEIETNTILTVNSQNISTVVTSLHPNYHYAISVTAVTVLPGPFSSSITLQTHQDGEQTNHNHTNYSHLKYTTDREIK